jgi:hypothetical protein
MTRPLRSVLGLIVAAILAGSGCGITPSWPERLDASGFRESHYLRDPPCQDQVDLVRDVACEASIVQQDSGHYVFQATYGGLTDVVDVPPRTMTEAEVSKMLSLFSDLHVDPADGLFCHAPVLGYDGWENFLRWDEREFITYGCSQPRIDYGQVDQIGGFLTSLVEAE